MTDATTAWQEHTDHSNQHDADRSNGAPGLAGTAL